MAYFRTSEAPESTEKYYFVSKTTDKYENVWLNIRNIKECILFFCAAQRFLRGQKKLYAEIYVLCKCQGNLIDSKCNHVPEDRSLLNHDTQCSVWHD